MNFVRQELGEGARPRMEEFFTQLEALNDFHVNLKISPGPRIKSYATQLDHFVEAIAVFFNLIFKKPDGSLRECFYHDAIAKALHADDVILSFNYDCLMDDSLRRNAANRWDPTRSYGVPIANGVVDWATRISMRGQPPKTPIRLCKLHGSLNWDRNNSASNGGNIALRSDPYSDTGRDKTEVIAPVWDKRISGDDVFRELWKQARITLPTGPVLVVAGYSVPPTDMLSQVLMRVSSSERPSNRKLSHLIIVNPDQAARTRLIELVQLGLSNWTVIIELNTMQELAELLS